MTQQRSLCVAFALSVFLSCHTASAQRANGAECANCGANVSSRSKVGDTCPSCGVRWTHVEDDSASPAGFVALGCMAIFAGLVVCTVIGVVGFVKHQSKKKPRPTSQTNRPMNQPQPQQAPPGPWQQQQQAFQQQQQQIAWQAQQQAANKPPENWNQS